MNMSVEDLDTPVLLIDADALERTLQRMQTITADTGIAYRPHSKSHKSPTKCVPPESSSKSYPVEGQAPR